MISAGATKMARPPAAIAAIALIAAIYGWALFATSFRYPGMIGPNYNTPGTDFMVFHSGLATALRGDMPLLFDGHRFTAFLNSRYHDVLSMPLEYRPWVYPPSFLLLILPLAPLGSFLAALLVFEAATALALGAALVVGAQNRQAAWRLAAACLVAPVASVTVLWGQTSFLIAALLVGGTRLVARRPILGGCVLGLLSVKPQHALMVPAMLLALRSWRAIAAAGISAGALALGSCVVFGAGMWRDWADAARHYATDAQPWDSSFRTCLSMLGASPAVAGGLEATAILLCFALVYAIYRLPVRAPVRLAVLLAAGNLAAPHAGNYDMLVLVIAAGLVLADQVRVHSTLAWTMGLCIWLLPLVGQPIISPLARFAPLLIVTLLIWLVREGLQPSPGLGEPLTSTAT